MIGVDGERSDVGDLGPDGDVLAEHLDFRPALGELAASGAGGLEADEDDGVSTVGKHAGQVVQDPPTGRHSRGRDDDGRMGQVGERLGLLDISDFGELSGVEGIGSALQFGSHVVGTVGDGRAVDLERS